MLDAHFADVVKMLYAMRTGKLTAGLGLLRRLDILIRYKVVKYDCHPTVICESAGTQAEDAATMRDLYLQAVERMGTH